MIRWVLLLHLCIAGIFPLQSQTPEQEWKKYISLRNENYSQGKYREACVYAQKAWKIANENWGEKHPHNLTSLHNLALLYEVQGRYDKAQPLHEKALIIDYFFKTTCRPDCHSSKPTFMTYGFPSFFVQFYGI